MTEFELALRKKLYRANCPTADTVHQFYWRELSVKQYIEVLWHMRGCQHCSAEYAERVNLLAPSPKKPFALPTPAKVLIAAVEDALTPAPQMRYAMRGKRQKQSLMYETSDEYVVFLNWREDEQARFSLVGNLFPPYETTIQAGVRLTSLGDGTVLETDLLTDGDFVFNSLDLGLYQLSILLPEQQIIVPHVEIAV